MTSSTPSSLLRAIRVDTAQAAQLHPSIERVTLRVAASETPANNKQPSNAIDFTMTVSPRRGLAEQLRCQKWKTPDTDDERGRDPEHDLAQAVAPRVLTRAFRPALRILRDPSRSVSEIEAQPQQTHRGQHEIGPIRFQPQE